MSWTGRAASLARGFFIVITYRMFVWLYDTNISSDCQENMAKYDDRFGWQMI
ncbi:hypothetical protein FD47_GL002957 [Lentilactobacillus parafarraginis DSM 18390 = JCM 14109]|uniref:Uncharacterized protein n=1 Tax=Lentilactobacillus parafarraginis DSM 18390 = JCM 14109 TaxID=1423786 RepID=A0A0R1YCS7_9LACO|nr:hypothetical protein FD47_GL002957 [Lentilactobacillus parafarraginis DSM 18390 = JCM 14109]